MYLKDADALEQEIARLYHAGVPVEEIGPRLRNQEVYHYSTYLCRQLQVVAVLFELMEEKEAATNSRG